MKYKDLYPDMKPIFDERKGMIRSEPGGEKPCHWCKEPTEYVDICYEGHFCSQECMKDFEEDIGV